MDESLVNIRIAETKEYSKCLPLFNLLYHGDVGPDFRHIFEDYAAKEEGIILLAESSYGLVGILVGSYHLDIDREGRTSRIDAIIVEEAKRKKGDWHKANTLFHQNSEKEKMQSRQV